MSQFIIELLGKLIKCLSFAARFRAPFPHTAEPLVRGILVQVSGSNF